jgi:hypothetical protein
MKSLRWIFPNPAQPGFRFPSTQDLKMMCGDHRQLGPTRQATERPPKRKERGGLTFM